MVAMAAMAVTAAPADFGIAPSSLAKLRALFDATPGLLRVWIFGSRALGHQRPESDIDLAVDAPGLSLHDRLALRDGLERLGLLYRIDLVFLQDPLGAEFIANILRDKREFWAPVRRLADVEAVGGVSLKDFQTEVLVTLGR